MTPRRSLKLPITLAVIMMSMLAVLIVGWILMAVNLWKTYKQGEAKDFVKDGRIELGGDLEHHRFAERRRQHLHTDGQVVGTGAERHAHARITSASRSFKPPLLRSSQSKNSRSAIRPYLMTSATPAAYSRSGRELRVSISAITHCG